MTLCSCTFRERAAHYNYFRDYDPATGRYVQSDPIGLLGGNNTYSYVDSSPLDWSDPEGLAKGDGKSKLCSRLRGVVVINCKLADRSCQDCDDCSTLTVKMVTKRSCFLSQRLLTRFCYAKDPSHGQRLDDMENGIKKCISIGASKGCNFGDLGDLSSLR